MARPKKQKEIPQEAVVESPTKDFSVQYYTFKTFIEQYAKANPAKYELKKEELLTRLNLLK